MGVGGSDLGVGCGEDTAEHSPGGGKPEKKGGKNEKKGHRERRKEISNSQTLTKPQSQGGQGTPARSSWSTTASEVNPASLGRYWKMDFQAQRATRNRKISRKALAWWSDTALLASQLCPTSQVLDDCSHHSPLPAQDIVQESPST